MKISQESGVRSQEKSKILQTPNPEPRTIFWGIRAQLIVGITIVTVGAIALIGFLSIKMLEWNALYRKGKEAEVIAIFIQTIVQEKQGAEAEGLKGFAIRIAEKGVIKDVNIVDEKGRVSFIIGHELISSKGESKNLFFISGLNIKMIGGGWFAGIGKELLVSAPLRSGSGVGGQGPAPAGFKQGSGSIMFSMSLSDIRDEVSNFKSFILFYALFDSIIIIIFGIYLFSRGIIRPMKLLKETAESIAGGMLAQRVDIKAGGEIGSFASSFNIMADRLEEKIRTLERLYKELLTTQEELVRSEKLATVGRLAAGVAHEIGNPLGAMLGYVDILQKQESGVSSQESGEILQRLEKEILRIDNIVRGLLDFSRPSVPMSGTKDVLQDVDVNKIVKDTVAMLLPQFANSAVSFDMRLNDSIPHIKGDEGKLQQVLLNLFLNARDAMESGGTIIVETAGTAMPEQNRKVKVRQDDTLGIAFIAMRSQVEAHGCIKISIADSGKGIAQSDIGKIFDPFFTTKDQGKGTGLGLTVSLGIIQAYGGDIKVRSEWGKGTTFEVFLPCSRNL